MKKHLLISILIIVIGFVFMYWSGQISETTNDNWQGLTGIAISVVGILVLVIPFATENIINPILSKRD